VIAAIATTAVLAACSGGGDSGAATTTVPPGSSVATTTTTIPITDVFAGLSDKTSTANVKITYTAALGTSVTLAQDGKGNSSAESHGVLLLSDGKRVVSCNGTTAAAKCTDLGPTSSNDALTQLVSSYARLSSLHSANLGHDSTQTIAGRTASCVTFKASDYANAVGGALPDPSKLTAAATVTVCVDDDSGFALKIALTDRGQTVNELLATQVGASSPSDFVPPSKPVTIPALTTTTTTPAG
jgi:hypothetical protein